MSKELVIKTMRPEEVDFAVELAAKEGWNPGLHDGSCFYGTDPEGFLIGYVDTKPIGCISAVSYQNLFGFIGFYIVRPEHRGQGYGIQLWNAAMSRLRNCNTGLDGVIEQQENYKKAGFKPAYSNIRYEYQVVKRIPLEETNIVDIQEIPYQLLEEYDRQCFPAPRKHFLKTWITMPQTKAVGYVEEGILCGYGVIRKCRQGHKIGPLFADDMHKAEMIYLKLCSYAQNNDFIYIDVPEVNQAGRIIADKYKMKKVFGTARMYTEKEPQVALSKVFGVTTFELG